VQAGDWSEIVDNFQPGDAEDWIACPFPSGRHGFVLRVVGDSMYNPGGDLSFRDGDFISVNPERDALHRSLVIARRNREKATFKQLLLDESEGPMLHTESELADTLHSVRQKHRDRRRRHRPVASARVTRALPAKPIPAASGYFFALSVQRRLTPRVWRHL
jgi:hypothetical protein